MPRTPSAAPFVRAGDGRAGSKDQRCRSLPTTAKLAQQVRRHASKKDPAVRVGENVHIAQRHPSQAERQHEVAAQARQRRAAWGRLVTLQEFEEHRARLSVSLARHPTLPPTRRQP
jgi:hypothetical protein